MNSRPPSESEIMTRLREPIGELVEKHCAEKTDLQKLRLRQLAWQAVDVIARTGNIAHIDQDKNIKRILNDIRQLGATESFIEESLALAIAIYKRMQAYHPDLLRKYSG